VPAGIGPVGDVDGDTAAESQARRYYAHHSQITEPGAAAALLEGITCGHPFTCPCCQRIAEYWDAAGKRRVLVDPDVPASTQSAWIAAHGGRVNGDTYGSLDLRESDAFVRGGEAWRRCRAVRPTRAISAAAAKARAWRASDKLCYRILKA
jgi:hypothetical protein